MLDNILIIVISFSILLSFLIAIVWKKKHFVKELYIGNGVSIVIYIITIAISIGLLTIYFATSRGLQYSWLYLLILLIFDWILLFVFCVMYTTCVYLKDGKLYKKNIFISKHIVLNRETKIIEKIDKTIIKSKNESISISSRYLTGSIRNLMNKVKKLIN